MASGERDALPVSAYVTISCLPSTKREGTDNKERSDDAKTAANHLDIWQEIDIGPYGLLME